MTRRRLIAACGLVLVGLWAAIGWMDEHRVQVDLTADRQLTLTAATDRVVRRLPGRTDLFLVMRPSDDGRSEAIALLDRYRRISTRLSVKVVDPERSPGLVRSLDAPEGATLVARRGGRVESATLVTEADVTGALARLLATRPPMVCSIAGHGEASMSDGAPAGLATFAERLRQRGFTVREVDLASTSAIPTRCRVAVLANPSAPLGRSTAAFDRYLDRGGRLLVLADPEHDVDLSALLGPFGLAIRHALVMEDDPGAHLPGDPFTVVARGFPGPDPMVVGLAPLVLPAVQAVRVTDVAGAAGRGLSSGAAVRSSENSWLEATPASPQRRTPGPFAVAATADRSEQVDPSTVLRTRVLAVGDVDLATNGLIDEGGNAAFLVQGIGWLAAEEELVSLTANLARVRPLDLTLAQVGYARLVLVGGVPLLCLLAGALVWAARRGR